MTASAHATRIGREEFDEIAPAAVAALRALGKAVDESGLEKPLTELIKVRASQVNGCAFCIQYHLNVARKLGVEAPKLDLLAAWREAGVHSPRERAALAWTEALTRMDRHSVSDANWAQVQAQFTRSEIAFLTASIGAINAWNRIAGALHFAPPVP
ncbi:MAG: carboxymuconolactone decarboxylase family protein [Burkholderiaceae bacterium]